MAITYNQPPSAEPLPDRESPMKPIALCLSLALLALPVAAESQDAGLSALQDLGQLNGQALACSQMAVSGKAKSLMIRHAPKTRRYGEVFEEATNAAFLEQGKIEGGCPTATVFTARLSVLTARLQASLPAAQ